MNRSGYFRPRIIFSAGLNPRLYAYCEIFKDFYPNEEGTIQKKIMDGLANGKLTIIKKDEQGNLIYSASSTSHIFEILMRTAFGLMPIGIMIAIGYYMYNEIKNADK